VAFLKLHNVLLQFKMSDTRRNSIEIKISYDVKQDKYICDSKLKSIFNKAKQAFQIKLPSGKWLLVKPDQKKPGVEDVTGLDDKIRLLPPTAPNRSPVRTSTSK
jgi:hypothetical protein